MAQAKRKNLLLIPLSSAQRLTPEGSRDCAEMFMNEAPSRSHFGYGGRKLWGIRQRGITRASQATHHTIVSSLKKRAQVL
jgi:hypothetical protein